jgi:hypothetical protein
VTSGHDPFIRQASQVRRTLCFGRIVVLSGVDATKLKMLLGRGRVIKCAGAGRVTHIGYCTL